ncbi:MAG: hypothetical protein U1D30_06980 [Planctomycetota bacterium]
MSGNTLTRTGVLSITLPDTATVTINADAGNDSINSPVAAGLAFVLRGEDGNDSPGRARPTGSKVEAPAVTQRSCANDTVDGGLGADSLSGGGGNDWLDAQADPWNDDGSADTISGDDGNDLIYGRQGADSLKGNADNDTLWGGSEDDTLDGGDGVDSLRGGMGDDRLLVFLPTADQSTADGEIGEDTVVFTGESDDAEWLLAESSISVVDVSVALAQIEHLELYLDGENSTLTLDPSFEGANLSIHVHGNPLDLLQFNLSGTEWDDTFAFDGTTLRFTGVGSWLSAPITFSGVGEISLVGGVGDDSVSFVGGASGDIWVLNDLTLTSSILPTIVLAGMETLSINGGEGDDDIDASEASTSLALELYGGAGADTIGGGIANDYVEGGAGNDSIAGGGGTDTLDGGVGDDILESGPAGSANLLLGGDGNDLLVGSGGDDDTLDGEAGDDTLDGGAGDDILVGGEGHDVYRFIDGDLGSDVLVENLDEGTDTLDFSLFSYGVHLDLADDAEQVVQAGELSLTLWSDLDFEVVIGSGYADHITGNETDNVLLGGGGADTLVGGDGNDTLEGGAGNDSIVGGLGDDHYRFVGGGLGEDTVVEQANEGRDELDFSSFSYGVSLNLSTETEQTVATSNLLLTLTSEDGFEDVTGSGSADHLVGNDANNLLVGGGGADTLEGGDDVDTLDGGAGNDSLVGGLGDDLYRFVGGGLGEDAVMEGANEGVDTLDLSLFTPGITLNLSTTTSQQTVLASELSLSLSTSLEVAIGTAGNDTLTANNAGSWLQGGAGADTLTGGTGDDTLQGDAGNDSLVGNVGDDTCIGSRRQFRHGHAGRGTSNALPISSTSPSLQERFGQSFAGHATDSPIKQILLTLSNGVNFEAVVESAYGDSLIGNIGNNTPGRRQVTIRSKERRGRPASRRSGGR